MLFTDLSYFFRRYNKTNYLMAVLSASREIVCFLRIQVSIELLWKDWNSRENKIKYFSRGQTLNILYTQKDQLIELMLLAACTYK
jgi:hypothetical protein